MKLVIISRKELNEVKELQLLARAAGHDCEIRDLTSLEQEVDADIVFWRSASLSKRYPNAIGRAMAIEKLSRKCPIVNATLGAFPLTTQKAFQQLRVARATKNVNAIPTYAAQSRGDLEELLRDGKLSYPFIAKPNQGSQGNGVELISSSDEIETIQDFEQTIFQPYLENSGEYRAFIVGGVAVDVVGRAATDSSTKPFLNCLNVGGKMVAVPQDEDYHEITKRGEQIAAALNLTFAGIDVVKDKKSGEYFFLEANTVPEWVVFKEVLREDIAQHVLTLLESIQKRTEGVPTLQLVEEWYAYAARFLPVKKQFHYWSRRYLWSGGRIGRTELDALQATWLRTPQELQYRLRSLPKESVPDDRDGGRAYRREYFKKHHSIYGYNNIFFHLLFSKTIYGEHAFVEEVLSACDHEHLNSIWEHLRNAPQAVFALSTHAINFFYLCNFCFGERYPLPTELLHDWASQEHDLGDTQGHEARLYLITHAVIGASAFYSRRIEDPSTYLPLMQVAEEVIRNNYAHISLDIKNEFLVCCRLLGYETGLQEVIFSETDNSLSPHGNFIVDTLNSAPSQPYKKTLDTSEHRNVLALMTRESFVPLGS